MTQVLDAGERVLRELVEKFPTVRAVWDYRKWRARFHEKPVEPRDPELDEIPSILEQVKRYRARRDP